MHGEKSPPPRREEAPEKAPLLDQDAIDEEAQDKHTKNHHDENENGGRQGVMTPFEERQMSLKKMQIESQAPASSSSSSSPPATATVTTEAETSSSSSFFQTLAQNSNQASPKSDNDNDDDENEKRHSSFTHFAQHYWQDLHQQQQKADIAMDSHDLRRDSIQAHADISLYPSLPRKSTEGACFTRKDEKADRKALDQSINLNYNAEEDDSEDDSSHVSAHDHDCHRRKLSKNSAALQSFHQSHQELLQSWDDPDHPKKDGSLLDEIKQHPRRGRRRSAPQKELEKFLPKPRLDYRQISQQDNTGKNNNPQQKVSAPNESAKDAHVHGSPNTTKNNAQREPTIFELFEQRRRQQEQEQEHLAAILKATETVTGTETVKDAGDNGSQDDSINNSSSSSQDAANAKQVSSTTNLFEQEHTAANKKHVAKATPVTSGTAAVSTDEDAHGNDDHHHSNSSSRGNTSNGVKAIDTATATATATNNKSNNGKDGNEAAREPTIFEVFEQRRRKRRLAEEHLQLSLSSLREKNTMEDSVNSNQTYPNQQPKSDGDNIKGGPSVGVGIAVGTKVDDQQLQQQPHQRRGVEAQQQHPRQQPRVYDHSHQARSRLNRAPARTNSSGRRPIVPRGLSSSEIASPPLAMASPTTLRRFRSLASSGASSGKEQQRSQRSVNSKGEEVVPGAYRQAPGQNRMGRNRPVRNSVISRHSASAQMRSGNSVGTSGGKSSGGASRGGGDSSVKSSRSARRHGVHENLSDSFVSRDGTAMSSVEDFYEPMPDYIIEHIEPPTNVHCANTDGKDNGDSNDALYNRKVAASIALSPAAVGAASTSESDDDSSRWNGDNNNDGRLNDMTKAPPKTTYSVSSATPQTSKSNEGSEQQDRLTPFPTSFDRMARHKQSYLSESYRSTISNMTEDDVPAPPDHDFDDIEHHPDYGDLVEEEEEKEEITSPLCDMSLEDSQSSIVGPLADFSNGRQSRRTTGTTQNTRMTLNHRFGPSRTKTDPNRRFTVRMSLVSEHSSEESYSSELSLTEFKRRVSSMGSMSHSTTSSTDDVAKYSAGRIARNMSLYMRAGALPVAATVVGSDDDDDELEVELREQLEKEIRQELEIEMEDFRRKLILQVVGAAEPITAEVISASVRPAGDEEEPTNFERQRRNQLIPVAVEEAKEEIEVQGTDTKMMNNLRAAQDQFERAEAAAVRSNMNRELGRMYMHMKHSRYLSNLDDDINVDYDGTSNLSLFDRNTISRRRMVQHDEELGEQQGEEVSDDRRQRGNTSINKMLPPFGCLGVWIVFVLSMLVGLAIGIGIVFGIYERMSQ